MDKKEKSSLGKAGSPEPGVKTRWSPECAVHLKVLDLLILTIPGEVQALKIEKFNLGKAASPEPGVRTRWSPECAVHLKVGHSLILTIPGENMGLVISLKW